MGALLRSIDAVLFLCFLFVALIVPLVHLDGRRLPLSDDQIPRVVSDFRIWFTVTTGNYLLSERPPFYVGLEWLLIAFIWPMSWANLYGIFASKSWFSTTCLISGVAVVSGIAAVFAEVTGSGKGTDNLLMFYYFNFGFGILASLRGLLGNSSSATITNKSSTTHPRKKRAREK